MSKASWVRTVEQEFTEITKTWHKYTDMFFAGALQNFLEESAAWSVGFSQWGRIFFLLQEARGASCTDEKVKQFWAVVADPSSAHSSRAKCLFFSSLMFSYLLGLAFPTVFSLEHSKVFSFFIPHPAQHTAFSALLAIGEDYYSQIYSPPVKTFLQL